MGRHGDDDDAKPESVAEAVTEMKIENEESPSDGSAPDTPRDEVVVNGSVTPSKPTPIVTTDAKETSTTTNGTSPNTTPPDAESPAVKSRSQSESPTKDEDEDDEEKEEKMGGEITVKMEPGQPPKLARTSSQKVVTRPPPLYNHLPDDTDAAKATFQLMESCTYSNKYMGYTEHAMECDCAEEWDATEGKNLACGDYSDCINRATKMECTGDCGCGDDCQNTRFQRQEYADVAVISTEKKGFGLRTNVDLRPHELVYEYIGEVINENQFRRRMIQYDEEGIKHFYFMSLSKGEFVDATRKGNLGRFCNHSCNPNCYVDKWVVGEKLRMGIFAERHVKAGEELVFNYNVDRYGADPQPCYCGEPNCTGFIGGKTQTERGTKLSNATIEALGIDDGDGWDTAVARKPRKKKTGEDDEEYVDSVQPKSLNEDGVTKVMAALMQCKEKWIAVKLLGRIQRCEDERVRNRVVKMHGYQILNSQLSTWKDDFNVVLQILDILDGFPRLTRNKIIDSKIESTVQPLVECGDERVEKKAAALLKVWSTLEVGYRIPRLKRDPAAATAASTRVNQFERRETTKDDRNNRAKSRTRSRSRSRSIDAPRGPAAQTRGGMGPRNHQRHHGHGPRPFRRPPPKNMLPPGWFATTDANGSTYYYSSRGETTWTRPTMPAAEPPPPPPKPESKTKALQDIIDGIMNAKEATPKDKSATPATPQPAQSAPSEKKKKEEKWRSQSEEKQKRLYENTLFPHVKYVMDKFKHKLPRDDLKRYAKEVAKKLVSSDFKNKRVDDPTTITEKKKKQVKVYCKEYFDKAVVKHKAYEKKKAEKKAKLEKSKGGADKSEKSSEKPSIQTKKEDESDDDVKLSDDEMDNAGENKSSPRSLEGGENRKRKRESENGDDGPGSPSKKQKSASPDPPPPPPPPRSASPSSGSAENLKRKRDDYCDNDEKDGGASPMKRQRSETPPAPPPPPPPADTPDPQDAENNSDAEERGRTYTISRTAYPTSRGDVNGFSSSRRSSFQSNGSRSRSSRRPSSSGSHHKHNNNKNRDFSIEEKV